MLKMKKQGQTLLEYAALLIIVMGALLGIGNYFKRGLQGRWKSAVDELGDQYDPRVADSDVRHTLVFTTNTTITANVETGTTTRVDSSSSAERKTGNIQVSAY